MSEEGNDEIFEEEEAGCLTKVSKKKVHTHIYNFIKNKTSAKKEEIVNVCKAAVNIFDSMKSNDDVGIVSIFDFMI